MKLTRKKALEYHRQMWTEMQKDLGDNGSIASRADYKEKWCRKNFPGKDILYNCFLCQYTVQQIEDPLFFISQDCKRYCPIDWNTGFSNAGMPCQNKIDWRTFPISEILALPEKYTPFYYLNKIIDKILSHIFKKCVFYAYRYTNR